MAVKLILSEDGSSTLYSEEFGVHYHSIFGAIMESRHVFIDAALRYKLAEKDALSILEIGLGTGLNALLTCLETKQHSCTIKYTGLEKFPLSASVYEKLNYPDLLPEFPEADLLLKEIHQSLWGKSFSLTDHFQLEKVEEDFNDYSYSPRFDIVYFDAFAPNAQPELWEEALLQKMYDALLPKGVLVTYCAKGVVKRRLKSLGFQVESLPGPPRKREMTRAIKAS
jgi:tRNA U34 5-methylaminomethyl-2-thiouridine-forming methyltransferase MnmC